MDIDLQKHLQDTQTIINSIQKATAIVAQRETELKQVNIFAAQESKSKREWANRAQTAETELTALKQKYDPQIRKDKIAALESQSVDLRKQADAALAEAEKLDLGT